MIKLLLLFVFISVAVWGQEYQLEEFDIVLSSGELKVSTKVGELLYKRDFAAPTLNLTDLDDDGVEELIIIDSVNSGGSAEYLLIIYNLIDGFYPADSINSGSTIPYIATSDEIEGLILITGNSDFMEFNLDKAEKFLPMNVWRYDSGELLSLDDEIYELFLTENDIIISFIEAVVNERGDCAASKECENAIAAGFANYLSAGEGSLADNMLKKFYRCGDIESFRNRIETSSRKE